VGTGMMTLSGTNSTYTGSTTINDGTLALANPLVLQNSPLVTTGGGELALDVGITSTTFGGLSGASGNLNTIISNYSSVTNLTLNPAAGSVLTYGGVIANGATGMSLTKTGAGTQILSGANTYTGTTTVSEGTLVASNSNLTANIQPDSTQVIFTTQPSVGTYNILPGPLNTASLLSFNVSGTGGLTANLTNSPNLQVILTSTSAGPTFATTYPEGSENAIGQNGLKNLMSYALGGTGPSSNPALPVLTVNGSVLTLTATGRNDDPSLRFYGQWTTDLSGATDSFENNSVELTPPNLSFSQSVETGKPRKFMRLKVTKQ
jgi:autotransporter-associated beta strand protein